MRTRQLKARTEVSITNFQLRLTNKCKMHLPSSIPIDIQFIVSITIIIQAIYSSRLRYIMYNFEYVQWYPLRKKQVTTC